MLHTAALHDVVHEDARHAHGLRIGDAIHDALDLRDHDAAVILRRLRDRQHFGNQALAFHAEIAARICVRRADQPDVDRHRLVAQPRLPIDLDALDERLGRARIQPSAALRGVYESVQPDLRDEPWALRRDLAQQHAEHALRKIVGLDRICQRERPELWREVPMSADDPLQQSGVREVIQPTLGTIPLPCAVVEREIARCAGFQKAPLQRGGEQFRMARADEAAHGHRRTDRDGGDGFVGSRANRERAHDYPRQPPLISIV